MIRFTIPGEPRGKGRPRVTTIGGHARAFTDKATASYEALVRMAAAAAHAGPPLEGPVTVDLLVVLTRPKRLMRRADPPGLIACDTKPDIDNVVKSILDGCGCLWRGDQQVSDLTVRKRYAEREGAARVEVAVKGEQAP